MFVVKGVITGEWTFECKDLKIYEVKFNKPYCVLKVFDKIVGKELLHDVIYCKLVPVSELLSNRKFHFLDAVLLKEFYENKFEYIMRYFKLLNHVIFYEDYIITVRMFNPLIFEKTEEIQEYFTIYVKRNNETISYVSDCYMCYSFSKHDVKIVQEYFKGFIEKVKRNIKKYNSFVEIYIDILKMFINKSNEILKKVSRMKYTVEYDVEDTKSLLIPLLEKVKGEAL